MTAIRENNHAVSNWTAFGAGVLGGIVMTALLAIARAVGLTQMNMSMALGSMFGWMPSTGTWFLGFAMHLMISGLIGLIYAAAFRGFNRSGAGVGTAFAVVHWLIGGMVMGMMPMMHALMPEQMPAPGFFAINAGLTTAVLVLVEHLIYGAVVGAVYHNAAVKTADPLRSRRAATV